MTRDRVGRSLFQRGRKMAAITKQSALVMRYCVEDDHDDVAEIEATTLGSWRKADIRAHVGGLKRVAYVVETPEQIVGWLAYTLHARHCQINRIVVHPGFRRAGVGKMMIGKLIIRLGQWRRENRRDFLRADVPDSALGTHLFFKAMGFEARCFGGKYRFEKWGD